MTDVLVVDDEPNARRRIVRYLKPLDYISRIYEAENGEDAIEQILNKRPNVLFLDVQMPVLNGIDAIKQVPKEFRPATIFTTAYDEYAIEAFDQGVIDYLVKPIGKDRFLRALGRALEQQSRDHLHAMLDSFSKKETSQNRILCKYANRYVVVNIARILYITTEYRDVFVYTNDNKKYSTNLHIDELQKILDPKIFMRIHRSSILNIDSNYQIEPWQDGRLKIFFENQAEITVSRDKAKALKEILGIKLRS